MNISLIIIKIKVLFQPILDQNERCFLKNNNLKDFNPKYNDIFIEVVHDYIYVKMIESLIKKHPNNNFIGLNANKFIVKRIDFLIIPYLYRYINYTKDRIKFKKLFMSVGLTKIYTFSDISLRTLLKNLFKSFTFLSRVKTIKNLIASKYDDILVGDIIYDSYIRFENKPSFSKKGSFYLFIFYVFRFFNSISILESITEKYNFKKTFCIYASYVTHGSIIRFFIKKNVKVYTSGTEMKLFSLHPNGHIYESLKHSNYKNDFSKISNQSSCIIEAKKKLEQRFNGIPDLNYMYTSSYHTNNNKEKLNLNNYGIVFMHDFFDCIHIYDGMIFNDFLHWVEYLIEISLKHNLKIAFKPHPLERQESKVVSENLKLKYPKIKWLDTKTSNNEIFKSGIKFGTSIYGTVLSELAYHGIKCISAGDNPLSSFDFCYQAKSIGEYEKLIINPDLISVSKNYKEDVCKYYFMHYLNHRSDVEIDIPREIISKRFIGHDSSILNFKF